MVYRVRIEKRAEKELGGAQAKIQARLIEAIDSLSDDPFAGRPLRGPWKGFRRVRVGDYRIVYQVLAEQSIVQVLHIRHRRDAYARPK